MDEYIIGSVLEARGKIGAAEQEYLKAVQVFTALGDRSAIRLARVYSDLAVINIRTNNMPRAEIYLQRAADSENLVKSKDPIERLARLDATIHLADTKGNTSEAIRLNSLLIKLYGSDNNIPAIQRAHVYADRGGRCIRFANTMKAC